MRSNPLLIFAVSSFFFVGMLSCAASESAQSISDSVSSPFEWASNSMSSSSGGDTAYQQDVSEFTLAFATTGGDLEGFRMGIRTLAEQRGITSWEADPSTCASIGHGVRRADYDRLAALDFGEELFGQNAGALAAYQSGYAAIP
jgi:hypothetical protein